MVGTPPYGVGLRDKSWLHLQLKGLAILVRKCTAAAPIANQNIARVREMEGSRSIPLPTSKDLSIHESEYVLLFVTKFPQLCFWGESIGSSSQSALHWHVQ